MTLTRMQSQERLRLGRMQSVQRSSRARAAEEFIYAPPPKARERGDNCLSRLFQRPPRLLGNSEGHNRAAERELMSQETLGPGVLPLRWTSRMAGYDGD